MHLTRHSIIPYMTIWNSIAYINKRYLIFFLYWSIRILIHHDWEKYTCWINTVNRFWDVWNQLAYSCKVVQKSCSSHDYMYHLGHRKYYTICRQLYKIRRVDFEPRKYATSRVDSTWVFLSVIRSLSLIGARCLLKTLTLWECTIFKCISIQKIFFSIIITHYWDVLIKSHSSYI